MTDEITTEETASEETVPTPEETTPEVELNDEMVAQYLGVDPEFFAKEVKPQAKGLDKLYAKLNKARSEQARSEQTPSAPQSVSEDDEVELDPRAKKALERFFAEKIAPVVEMQQSVVQGEIEEVIETFSSSHNDVPADKVDEVMQEYGLWNVKTPAQLKRNLERAYKLAKADLFDPEVEVAKRLAKSKDDDTEVVEVKSKRSTIEKPRSEDEVVQDDSIPWNRLMDMFSKTE